MLDKMRSLTSFYRDMNPSNLSGAIDIIAVRGKDGAISSTPFHIRFGKRHILRIHEHSITMFVNGKICPIGMKLSKNGDVYFEKEDDEDSTNLDDESERKNNKETKKKNASFNTTNGADDSEGLSSSSNSSGADVKLCENFDKCTKMIDEPPLLNSNAYNSITGEKQRNRQTELICKRLNLDKPFYFITNNVEKSKKPLYDKMSLRYFYNILLSVLEIEELYEIRRENKKKRLFFSRERPNIHIKLAEKYNTFHKLITSEEYYDELIKSHEKLYAVLLGLIKPEKSPVCNQKDGCKGAEITFSLCSKQSLFNKNIYKVFENFRSRSMENTKDMIVRITGCGKCKNEFFMYYDLFTEIFFYHRNLVFCENRSKKRKFLEFLEKRCGSNRLFGFFRKNSMQKEQILTLKLSSKQLERMELKPGKNELQFKIDGTNQCISTNCYFWENDVKIIISDIDGTITKSDKLGHVYTMIGKDWTHAGVAGLFTKIVKNDYKIVYLSSRPIGQMEYTKKYLSGIKQNGCELPDGPVLLSPDGLFGAIYREMILKRPEEFKIACLKTLQSLFSTNPLFGGFGNRQTDVITYRTVGIDISRIFTIDSYGVIIPECSTTISGSYLTLNSIVDNIFPPLKKYVKFNSVLLKRWWSSHI
ncbi:hypothetical protein EDEG_00238 [Edhazardia aedis USNM 41457]|uniref:LNS2/PITP domain-containing protein n=1 Tax=Edhazardia aedis (strain USNM 41457) TaxID=1003232 RepID=J8ZUA9_EDHAE|nr:hypothetical protein EDEG_00238 [Edhazardia aedis USNM 41457]|eukprot:EJW03258.1 hypothetical protein EDEG_00238 [Edhazardia aedis USNM 41457]